MRFFKILILILFVSSCREVKQSVLPQVELGLSNFIVQEYPYVGDESLDVFLLNPWYTYDENNHIIWPNFQVYVLKAKGKYYKIQVADYYDDLSVPGHYTLRIQEEGLDAYEWDFNAQGCGNVYTNLTFKECLRDPSRNVYTYLDIENLSSWQMSESAAQENLRWDIAFNGTEVKINSGRNGRGNTRIGDLYLYGAFFNGEVADFQRIAEVSFADKGKRFFELDLNLQEAALSLPQGIDRVIYEEDWLNQEDPSKFTAHSDLWWMLWGGEESSFFKLRVKKVSDNLIDEVIESEITFEFFQQVSGTSTFETDSYEWTLPKFNSSQRLIKWCLDFDSQKVVDCSDDSWDLRFSVSSRNGIRRWRINVNRGAIGPLSEGDMLWRMSGLPPFL